MCGKEYYRLVFRDIDRETGSAFATPSFRCQLPENLYKNGTNKKIKVYLDYFSITTDGTTPHDVVILKMRNFSINGSQTVSAGRFEALSTLGVAEMNAVVNPAENEVFCTTRGIRNGYLEFNSFQFNQGKIEFVLELLNRAAPVKAANGGFVIMLGIEAESD